MRNTLFHVSPLSPPFSRTEQYGTIRSQTLRLLGLLGALDPYKHKMNLGQIDSATVNSAPLIPISDAANEMEQSWEMSPSELLVNMGTGRGLYALSIINITCSLEKKHQLFALIRLR